MNSHLFSGILFALLLHVVNSAAEKTGELTAVLGKNNVKLSWYTDIEDQSVLFDVRHDGELSMIGIGFSDHGEYNHSDICIFHRDELKDYYINREFVLELDLGQDCQLVSTYTNGFRFRRRFSTCDPRDYAFETGTTQFIVAGGYEFSRYFASNRVMKEMHYGLLFDTHEPETRETATTAFTVVADKAHVPSEETTYWCTVRRISTNMRKHKHHVIKMESVIQHGNEHLVHHMEIFMCFGEQEEYSGNCNSDKKPAQAKTCSHVIAAWAMGEDAILYPAEAGLPIGGPGASQYVMVEIHYNNPQLHSGIVDSSGFKFTVTPQLRPYDAGIIELGLIYSDANSIPPHQKEFAITASCIEDCTRKLPDDGINVFASQLHAHLTGRKLWTSHYRKGVKLGELNRDDHYSPHWQHLQHMHPHIKVLPGDVLRTTCVYDTTKRAKMTLGGYSITDEMCVNYIYYYPASDVEVCKSAVDNSTLREYFQHRHQLKNAKTEAIDKLYAQIKWNDENVDSLRELYSVGSLNMACLAHNGQLFPRHHSNWTNVPQPQLYSGPFNKKREQLECPAINA